MISLIPDSILTNRLENGLFLLSINKTTLIIFTSLLIILILFIFVFSFLSNEKSITKITDITTNKSDIVSPKFSISGKKSKITPRHKCGKCGHFWAFLQRFAENTTISPNYIYS